jgi:hypothetical protein
MNEEIKIFQQKELGYQIKRETIIKIIDIIREQNLSLNQALEVLDLVKENLKEKPMWD